MKTNKAFWFCYLLLLAVFILLGTALSLRTAELRRGNMFYEAFVGAEPGMTAPSKAPASPEASAVPEKREGAPNSPERHELSLRLSQFGRTYPNAAIWIQLPGTPLDYPVMLGADNQFYLNHLPDGSKNALGSLFLDYRTGEDSVHLIVYGHNGAGGTMFGLLRQYESQDYWLEHRALTVATRDAVYICPIFSVRRVAADSSACRLAFEGENSLMEYINQAAAGSLYQTDVDLERWASVLTLSTCTVWHSQRLIVQALLPPVQSA